MNVLQQTNTSLLRNIPIKPVISGYLALSQSLLQTCWVKVKIHQGRNSSKISILNVIQIQLLSRSLTSSFKISALISRSRSSCCEDQRAVTAEIKVVLFYRNDMTRDARRNGRCDSIIIFEIMTIFCTKIQVKSLINYVVQIGWPPYWKFTVIKNFLL